jgi:exodeoxyribonuclease VII small subunit
MHDGMAASPELAELSFEDALRRLEAIVQQLERGDVPLEQSIALYAEGNQLREQCQKRLDMAQARIEQIVGTADGAAGKTAPFPAV